MKQAKSNSLISVVAIKDRYHYLEIKFNKTLGSELRRASFLGKKR